MAKFEQRLFVANAFSLSMLRTALRNTAKDGYESIPIEVYPLTLEQAIETVETYAGDNLEIVSVIGHASTAAIVNSLLGTDLPSHRLSIDLTESDEILVAQYVGPRLPEGCTELPKGSAIEWAIVRLDT